MAVNGLSRQVGGKHILIAYLRKGVGEAIRGLLVIDCEPRRPSAQPETPANEGSRLDFVLARIHIITL